MEHKDIKIDKGLLTFIKHCKEPGNCLECEHAADCNQEMLALHEVFSLN